MKTTIEKRGKLLDNIVTFGERVKRNLVFFLAIFAALFALGGKAPEKSPGKFLQPAILEVLKSFPVHESDKDEDPKAREKRLGGVAEDVAIASSGDREKAAALLTIGKFESHHARWVGAGCVGTPPKGVGDCDKGKSRSYWQMKITACPEGWLHPPGSRRAQKEFAKCAARRWIGAYYRCKNDHPKGPLAGAYSGYWSMCQGLEDAEERSGVHTSVLSKLWRECAGSERGGSCRD